MVYLTPLRNLHEEYARPSAPHGELRPVTERPGAAVGTRIAPLELEVLPWGPPNADGDRCEIIATYGAVEAEYASIRRAAGLFDSPHRATLLVTGIDRRDFLNRLLTAELKDFEPGMARASFWLNRKGRIEADLLLIELGTQLLIDLDVHQAQHTLTTLNDFIFTEDVEIRNISEEKHHIAVHGKRALEVIAAASDDDDFTLGPNCAASVLIASTDVVVARRDVTGEIGIELMMEATHAPAVWERLVETDHQLAEGKRRVRPIGWYALNIARIEAGTPLFNIDFGPTNLPHETGLLKDRVSFTKGCYIGQEVVARMENLGKPKQMLVGLRIEGDLLPVAEAQVFAQTAEGEMGDQIGLVTSSTLSPLRASAPIAFAMIRTQYAREGETVLVNAEGEQVKAVVTPLGT